jgi:MFS transporter, OFA family, oxalate/formate antiporter
MDARISRDTGSAERPPLCGLRDCSTSQRIRVAVAAFWMQLALGAVYGWSVFLNPLIEQFSARKTAVNLTFTITLAVLGVTAALGGSLERRIGPRATATIAGVLYGGGVILSGFAPNLGALYLSYGVLGGVGLGLGYIVPLAVLIKCSPTSEASSPVWRSPASGWAP